MPGRPHRLMGEAIGLFVTDNLLCYRVESDLPSDANGDVGQMHYLGTFTEYTVVPEESVVVIDKDLPLEKACIVGCAVPTGWGSAVKRARVEPGSSVLVIGCGGIRTSAVQGARLSGARMIIVADINDAKLDMMGTFGATHFINNAKEDLKEKVNELTEGRGVDYAFEAIGTKKTQAETMEVTGKGGTSVFIGNESFFSESLPTSPEHFSLWSKNLLGILYGGCNTLTDIPKLLQLYRDGLVNLDDMITKEYRLEQINEAFDDMLAGKNIRGVIRFD